MSFSYCLSKRRGMLCRWDNQAHCLRVVGCFELSQECKQFYCFFEEALGHPIHCVESKQVQLVLSVPYAGTMIFANAMKNARVDCVRNLSLLECFVGNTNRSKNLSRFGGLPSGTTSPSIRPGIPPWRQTFQFVCHGFHGPV